MLVWGGVTFGICMLLVIFEYAVMSRKKGGLTPTDRKQLGSLLMFAFVMAGVVMFLYRLA